MSKKEKLKNKELYSAGLKDEQLIQLAGKLFKKFHKGKKGISKRDFLSDIKSLINHPDEFKNTYLAELAKKVGTAAGSPKKAPPEEPSGPIRPLDTPKKFSSYGEEAIEPDTFKQMEDAMRLPIAETGALMPDAHVGYGLPIGGVLATKKHIVIPYAVGMDIACRMCMSIFDPGEDWLRQNYRHLRNALISNTVFGNNSGSNKKDHPVLEESTWDSSGFIKQLKTKAARQLGSSGGGNHFVEWGILDLQQDGEFPELKKGKYLALLSHSGSRGLGANIAQHFSKLAKEKTPLPPPFNKLAWLDTRTEEGEQYWEYMNLAGRYASACHHTIHEKIAADLGLRPVKMVENHHNFAWKDQLEDGREVIIHRKGATPAGKDEEGIIPGSMTQTGFLVKGQGTAKALRSAAHGAGRTLSRKKAKQILNHDEVAKALQENSVELIGGGLDEAPMAYKDINGVMEAQQNLVRIAGKFYPRIVRMA